MTTIPTRTTRRSAPPPRPAKWPTNNPKATLLSGKRMRQLRITSYSAPAKTNKNTHPTVVINRRGTAEASEETEKTTTVSEAIGGVAISTAMIGHLAKANTKKTSRMAGVDPSETKGATTKDAETTGRVSSHTVSASTSVRSI